MSQLTDYIDRWKDARVLVVGDVMLDRYLRVTHAGQCPESDDAPIYRPQRSDRAPGGAANAAVNVRRLGGRVVLIGAVGPDYASRELRDLLHEADVDSRLVISPGQPTTTKTRLVGSGGRMLTRIDEDQAGLTLSEDRALATEIRNAVFLTRPDAVLLSDYSKGVLIPGSEVCAMLRELNPLIEHAILDPRRSLLGGEIAVDAVTPNRREAAALGGPKRERFFERLPGLQAIVETLGEKGAILRRKTLPDRLIRTRAAQSPQVCGAGDTFTAALVLARVAGADWVDATVIANAAAGVAVRHAGTYAPNAVEVIGALRY